MWLGIDFSGIILVRAGKNLPSLPGSISLA